MAHMLGSRQTAFLGAGVVLIGAAGIYTSRLKEERALAMANGFDGYLIKPIDTAELKALLESARAIRSRQSLV
jgi:CheY-like chemotaxis protein